MPKYNYRVQLKNKQKELLMLFLIYEERVSLESIVRFPMIMQPYKLNVMNLFWQEPILVTAHQISRCLH